MVLIVAGTLWSATDACGGRRPPGAIEQTGELRQLAGARSLSPFIRNGDSGQTDPCFLSLTALREKISGVDLPVAAYVTVPRSLARRAMIRSPPILRTIGNSSGVGSHLKRKVRSCAAESLVRSPTLSPVRNLAAGEQVPLPRSSWKRSQRKPVLYPPFAGQA
jgi:hypothetical protein